jgi:molybdopterin converting factor small subunit
MPVTVEYAAQIKRVAGVAHDIIELAGPCNVAEIARQVADNHGGQFADILLDENQQPRPSILVFVGENQIHWDDDKTLVQDGQTVTLLSPVSGG